MLRFLFHSLLTSLILSTLTACGGSSVENLEATCESLRVKMEPFENIGLLQRKLYYDGDSVATLLGNETRADNKRFIYQSFPFMRDYTIEGIQSEKYEKGFDDFRVQTAIHLFESTPNPIVLTEQDKLAIEKSDDPYEEVIKPKVIRVIGESFSDEGCVGLDNLNDVDYSMRVDELYADTQEAAQDSVRHLYGILLCERDFQIEGTKCDREDFKESFNYTNSTELTDEEIAILEERRQDAEREAQNPSNASVNANVSPGQICNNLGSTVQTNDYGELTCKLIWLNKVKALVWLRS